LSDKLKKREKREREREKERGYRLPYTKNILLSFTPNSDEIGSILVSLK
jgi:hypothetical protein